MNILRRFADLILLGLLAALAFAAYVPTHAYGATSGDSPGYLHNAGRLFRGLPLPYVDPLVKDGLAFFKDTKRAEWLVPQHSSVVNADGSVASKYPLGISLLMSWTAKLVGSDEGFYLVSPLAAVANVLLLYVLCRLAFRSLLPLRIGQITAFCTALFYGATPLVFDHVVADPHRDIPATFFLLVSLVLLFGARAYVRSFRVFVMIAVLSSVLLAFGLNVRETMVVALPAFLLLLIWSIRERLPSLWHPKAFGVAAACAIVAILTLLPTILNSQRISAVRRLATLPHETLVSTPLPSDTVLLSNADHARSLGIRNLLDNQGRFHPGVGSLLYNWKSLKAGLKSSLFLPLVFFGICWGLRQRKTRLQTTVLFLAGFGIFTLFSFWVNPYARYILPAFPFLFLFAGLGTASFLLFLGKHVSKPLGIAVGVLLLGTLGSVALPSLVDAVRADNVVSASNRPTSRTDLETVKRLSTDVPGAPDKRVLLVAGKFRTGVPEYIETHAHGLRAVPFPSTISVSTRLLFSYIDHLLDQGYAVSLWSDGSDASEISPLLDAFPSQLVGLYAFTFDRQIRIHKLAPRTEVPNGS